MQLKEFDYNLEMEVLPGDDGMTAMTQEDVVGWLEQSRLGMFVPHFRRMGMDGSRLLAVTNDPDSIGLVSDKRSPVPSLPYFAYPGV